MKGTPEPLLPLDRSSPAGIRKWLGPPSRKRWWLRATLLAVCGVVLLVWPIPIFLQLQRGVWLLPHLRHGGFSDSDFGSLHGRYLHGPMVDGTSCERFVPDSCYFIPGQKQPWQPPEPEDTVAFDVGEVLGECPFPAGGLYMDQPGPWRTRLSPEYWRLQIEGRLNCSLECTQLPPKFWRLPGEDRLKCGSGACCVKDRLQGYFYMDKATGQYELNTDKMGCGFHEFTRSEVFNCFHKKTDNSALVMIGDSMTRQVFTRAVTMFRGSKQSFDFGFHNSARYDVCANPRAGADRFQPADAPIGQFPFNYSGNLETDELFGETDYLGPSALDFCASQPLAIKYIWAISFEWQAYHLLKYLNTHDVSETVVTVMIGYHDRRQQVPPDYWAAIEAAAQRAKRVVLMTVPTSIIGEPLREQQGLWQARNKEVRDWVTQRQRLDNRVALVDFDKLAWMDGAPPGTQGHNWHYQCTLKFEAPEGGAAVLEAREKEHRFITPTGYAVHAFSVNEGKQDCVDDMNRVLMNMVFNTACNED